MMSVDLPLSTGVVIYTIIKSSKVGQAGPAFSEAVLAAPYHHLTLPCALAYLPGGSVSWSSLVQRWSWQVVVPWALLPTHLKNGCNVAFSSHHGLHLIAMTVQMSWGVARFVIVGEKKKKNIAIAKSFWFGRKKKNIFGFDGCQHSLYDQCVFIL